MRVWCPHLDGRPVRCCGTCHCTRQMPAVRPLSTQLSGTSLQQYRIYVPWQCFSSTLPKLHHENAQQRLYRLSTASIEARKIVIYLGRAQNVDNSPPPALLEPLPKYAPRCDVQLCIFELPGAGDGKHTFTGNSAARLSLSHAAPGQWLPGCQAAQV